MRMIVICLLLFTAVALNGLSTAGVFAKTDSPRQARAARPSAARVSSQNRRVKSRIATTARKPGNLWRAFSQNRRVNPRVVCDYPGRAPWRRREFNFASVVEAKEVVDRVLKATGVSRSVIGVEETDDEHVNAKSGMNNHGRLFIYYNPSFIDWIKRESRTELAADFVMVHEVGHLQSGHPFEDDGSNPQEEQQIRYRQELEADRYAGFNLRKMNAPLDKTLAAVNVYADERGTDKHPPKKARLEAIREGWTAADNEIKGLIAAGGAPTPAAPAVPRVAPVPAPRADARPTTGAQPAPSVRPAPSAPLILAGNTSRRLAPDWWSWIVYIDAPSEVLNQIKCVEYQLHHTFSPPAVRVCERGAGRPFAMRAEGDGTFTIQVHVFMKDNRRYDLNHYLRLQ